MPHKPLVFQSEAREKVLRGAAAIADAVRVTLGRRSRHVLIEPKWGQATTDYDREKLQERLAKLSGGVAVIRVGAPSCESRP